MNKQEFLRQLRMALAPLTAAEREDILADYEEHFRIAAETGHSEESVAHALGDPSELAQIYIEGMEPPPFDPTAPSLKTHVKGQSYRDAQGSASSRPASASTDWRPLITVGVVLFTIFIGIWLIFSLIMAVIGFWMVPVALFGGGIFTLVTGIVMASGIAQASLILASIAVLSLSILAGIGMVYVSKYTGKAVGWYFKSCSKLCKEGKL